MEWEGESGLVLMVPEAEPIVRELRYRSDPAAAAGIGAHITVLYPFVPLASLDGGVEQAVTLVAAGLSAFDLELTAGFGVGGLFPILPTGVISRGSCPTDWPTGAGRVSVSCSHPSGGST